jgi:hypothetical protein
MKKTRTVIPAQAGIQDLAFPISPIIAFFVKA